MTGIFGNHPEDRAMEKALHEWEDKQEENERNYEATIEARKISLEEGGEFYPFTPDGVREAINEQNIAALSAFLAAAEKYNGHDDDTNRWLYKAFSDVVKNYWEGIARHCIVEEN